MTWKNRVEDAVESVHEAMACHLEGLLPDGEPIPEQLPLETHQTSESYQGGTWALADVDLSTLTSLTNDADVR